MEQKDIDRIIEIACEDRTPFEAINIQFGFTEADVITLMRRELKRGSYFLIPQKKLLLTFPIRSGCFKQIFISTNCKAEIYYWRISKNPWGGKWTYDDENRLRYPKGKTPPKVDFPKPNAFWATLCFCANLIPMKYIVGLWNCLLMPMIG